tara:strand:- start:308 stop:427 length:120 start_codon:yes stop_codon:yes gene_type:complete
MKGEGVSMRKRKGKLILKKGAKAELLRLVREIKTTLLKR